MPQLLEEYKRRMKQGRKDMTRKTTTLITELTEQIRRLSMEEQIDPILTQTKRTPYRTYQGEQVYIDTIGPLEVWEQDPKSWPQDASVAQKRKWYQN